MGNDNRIERVDKLDKLGFFTYALTILKESLKDSQISPAEHERLKKFILSKINSLFNYKEKQQGFVALGVISLGLNRKS